MKTFIPVFTIATFCGLYLHIIYLSYGRLSLTSVLILILVGWPLYRFLAKRLLPLSVVALCLFCSPYLLFAVFGEKIPMLLFRYDEISFSAMGKRPPNPYQFLNSKIILQDNSPELYFFLCDPGKHVITIEHLSSTPFRPTDVSRFRYTIENRATRNVIIDPIYSTQHHELQRGVKIMIDNWTYFAGMEGEVLLEIDWYNKQMRIDTDKLRGAAKIGSLNDLVAQQGFTVTELDE